MGAVASEGASTGNKGFRCINYACEGKEGTIRIPEAAVSAYYPEPPWIFEIDGRWALVDAGDCLRWELSGRDDFDFDIPKALVEGGLVQRVEDINF